MDAVIAVLVAVGPLVLIVLGLVKAMRRVLHPGSTRPPLQRPGGFGFGLGRDPGRAGDRSPRRPRGPHLAGGAALPLPREDEALDDAIGVTVAGPASSQSRRAAS